MDLNDGVLFVLSKRHSSSSFTAACRGDDSALCRALQVLADGLEKGSLLTLVEALSSSREAWQTRNALRTIRWLARDRPKDLATALAKCLVLPRSQELQLEVLHLMDDLMGDVEAKAMNQDKRLSSRNRGRDTEQATVGGWICKTAGKDLGDMAAQQSKVSEGSRYRQPTETAIKCGDLFVKCVLLTAIEVQNLRDESSPSSFDWSQLLWDLRGPWGVYLKLLREWNLIAGRTSLFVVAVEDTYENLRVFDDLPFSQGASLALAAHMLCTAGTLMSESGLMEDEKVSEEVTRSALELSRTPLGKELGENEEDELRKAQLEEIAYVQLRRLCLLVGRVLLLEEERVLSVLDDSVKHVIEAASKQMTRQRQGTQTLALRLFARCLDFVLLPVGNKETEELRIVAAYSPMMEMLKTNDVASDCSIQVLAHGLVKHAAYLLPEVLGVLASWRRDANESATINALRLVREYVLLRLQSAPGSMRDSPYVQDLVNRLFEIVQTNTFRLREPAGQALAAFDASFIVPLLCSRVIAGENDTADSRSVTASALVQVFAHASNTLAVFETYVDVILTEAPAQPHRAMALVEISRRCAEAVPDHLWPSLLCCLAAKVLAHPNEPTLVGLVRKLSDPWGASFGFEAVEKVILPSMTSQKELDASHLEEDAASHVVQELLFQRLSPLLFLRTLPVSLFRSLELREQLSSCLLRRVLALYEFKEVRQMAVEVLARFPPRSTTFPLFLDLLRSFLEQDQLDPSTLTPITRSTLKSFDNGNGTKNEAIFPSDVRLAKAAVYGMCHCISVQGGKGVFTDVLDNLFLILALPVSNNDEMLIQLQQGATQCLAMLIACSWHVWAQLSRDQKADRPLITEVDDSKRPDIGMPQEEQGDKPGEGDIDAEEEVIGPLALRAIRHVLFDSSRTTAQRICASNSIVLAMRMVAQEAGLMEQAPATSSKNEKTQAPSFEEKRQSLQGLASIQLLESICTFLETTSEKVESRLLASCLQLMFTTLLLRSRALEAIQDEQEQEGRTKEMVLGSRPVILLERLCKLTLGGLGDEDALVRSASLKTVGVIFSLLANETALPDGVYGSFVQSLRGIANVDTNPECRTLAENLLRTCT